MVEQNKLCAHAQFLIQISARTVLLCRYDLVSWTVNALRVCGQTEVCL